MELEIWDMLPAEQKYSYSQSSQIMGQTGCIGHLRVDMDTNGEGFFSSWDDHMRHLKTDEFKQEFDDVIHMLRFNSEYDGILKNRTSLAKYCYSHPSCQMEDGRSFGIRVDTEQYSYLCRLNPNKGEYNGYMVVPGRYTVISSYGPNMPIARSPKSLPAFSRACTSGGITFRLGLCLSSQSIFGHCIPRMKSVFVIPKFLLASINI